MSTNLKRFLIYCSTAWCGMDNTYRAMAKCESDLWEIADHLAYENFLSFACSYDILEDLGYDPYEMSMDEIDEAMQDVNEADFYGATIEECEDDEEWDSYTDEIIIV